MRHCPHCGRDLRGTASPTAWRPDDRTTQVVTCPDCDGPVDGYAVG